MRAVLVVHGMGQQVRFQALDQIAQGLLREAGSAAPSPRARSVKIGDDTYQRLEIYMPLRTAASAKFTSTRRTGLRSRRGR